MKKLVLKDFLSLKKGDIISFSTGSGNVIYVTVENREVDVPFYGNEKGKWGKDNPAPKTGNIREDYKPNVHYIWVKEKINPFFAMELKMPLCPKDLTKHLTNIYSQYEWERVCIKNIIDDFETNGIVDTNNFGSK